MQGMPLCLEVNIQQRGPVAGVPFARRPSVDRSRAQMSRMNFHHLRNVTLFVTTGVGRNRQGATSGNSETTQTKGDRQSSSSNSSNSGILHDGGQLVSFANVETAYEEESPVPGSSCMSKDATKAAALSMGMGTCMARTQGLFLYSTETWTLLGGFSKDIASLVWKLRCPCY